MLNAQFFVVSVIVITDLEQDFLVDYFPISVVKFQCYINDVGDAIMLVNENKNVCA